MIIDIQKQGLKLKVTNDASDYLSCEIRMDVKNGLGWIGQPQ
jgi:hypothetical protein